MGEPRSFRDLIRYWRDDANLSLTAAASLAGITKSHLWELEQGRAQNPTIQTLAGLARAYGASLPYLACLAAAQLTPKTPPSVSDRRECASASEGNGLNKDLPNA